MPGARLLACGGFAVLLALQTQAGVRAEEVALYRLTGTEGYASLRYLYDGLDTSQPGATARQTQGDLREEVFLMTHGYAYHPNFLTLDLGAGPVFQQGRASSGAGDTSSSSSLYNLSARASFLRGKPYRGALFFEHLNPTLAVSPGTALTQENERYGMELSTTVPMAVSLDATRSRNEGRSLDRIIDDQIDQLNLRLSQALGRQGLTEFRYQATQQESMSGSPSLPVQRTRIDRENAQLDTRLRFGARAQYELFNVLTYDTQKFGLSPSPLPERTDRRVLLDLRGDHTERLKSFAGVTHSATDEGPLSTVLNAGSAGLSYAALENLSLRASARAEHNRAPQFTVRSRGADGSVQHRRTLPLGMLTTGYTVRLDQRDQLAAASVARVIGERLTLPGTTPVALAQPRVVLASIVVSNVTRTQTYLENVDYLVSVVGVTARIQRVVGGNILDGQDVLVDYDHDTGGTYAADQVDQALSINWGLRGVLDVYLRLFDASPTLKSGAPTTPLNEVRSTLLGARADVPVDRAQEVTLGGLYETEDRRETIAPFERQQLELYAQTGEPFFGSGVIRLTARRVRQDFENSPEDVRLAGYDLRVSTRHPLGLLVSANLSRERDTGGSVERTRLLAGARAQWRYRRANLTLEFTRLRETQGAFERDRTLAQLLFRRDF